MNEKTPEQIFEEEKNRLEKVIKKKLASFDKALEKATKSLQQGKAHHEVQHLGDLLKTNFAKLASGMSEIHVEDWMQEMKTVRIPLDPSASPKEMLEAIFKKSQKLKRSVVALEAYLEQLKSEQQKWQKSLQRLHTSETLQEVHTLENSLRLTPTKKTSSKKVTPSLPYHRFYSEAGIEIFVGKTAAANDVLTFQIARAGDLWLHANQVSGSHVVVRKKQEAEIDQETLQDALQLALYHSKGRATGQYGQEVLITERKYVSRQANAPKGQVNVTKHKVVTVILDKSRIDRLKRSAK